MPRPSAGSERLSWSTPSGASLRLKELVEIDLDVRQRVRPDDSILVQRIDVAAVGLPPPGTERPFVGVDAPDLQVAALLVLGELGVGVVVTCGRGPDLDGEGQRLGVGVER